MPRLEDLLRRTHPEHRTSNLDREDVDVEPPAEEEGVCAICKGARFLRRELPLGHPEFGQAVPCYCVEMEGQEVRLSRLQRYSNLGPLTRLTFDNLIRRGRSSDPSDQARFQRCVEDAETFARDPQGWLVLVGASGCGKTHVAAAVANRCLESGTPALFVVVPDLLAHLRAAYKPDAEVGYDELFEQVRSAPVLILDDLGTQSATPWAQEKLFQIINDRFNTRLPTIITTMSLTEFDDRMRSRLGDPEMEQPHADPVASVHILEQPRPPEYRQLNMLELAAIRDMAFDNFDLSDFRSARDRDWRTEAHRHALGFAAEPKGWMVLLGGLARDRTHLIAAIGNYRRRLGESPLLVRVSELLDFLRHAMYGEGIYYEAKKNIRRCPFLLLDELEIGMGSDYARRELFELLYWRYLSQLPTVITTPSQLTQLLSDNGWTRLARLMKNAAGFCSEITVGEESPEERVEPPKPSAPGSARRQGRKKTDTRSGGW